MIKDVYVYFTLFDPQLIKAVWVLFSPMSSSWRAMAKKVCSVKIFTTGERSSYMAEMFAGNVVVPCHGVTFDLKFSFFRLLSRPDFHNH